ncbi:MBOAT family protein [Siphonobacter sp. SORGH_AS_1065]|uniref:MBOAT family O-acyltransferase n=1 Tax=Siphonobacter sp. SORGH_AS_1065 TaxID=3041795 RepID=UPI002781D59C|nr:MBOAT family O-acyltransferase [Siphonobacter sp. SORGH_AS_1065]MDQ1087557.1 alginate O-acetyltransferase complex protein AlgI [Siphonobacter sp. SORGH_AS_1065]
MLFNSLSYAVFLPVVFIVYWVFLKDSFKKQNIFLLIVSYFFYSFWDWRFLFLLMFSTFLDFYTGIKIHKSTTDNLKKIWLFISVGVNLGFLSFFKYYNFFVDSFVDFLSNVGFNVSYSLINIVLPVGISFYTFHGLSYVFDIYNNKSKPTNNLINYSLFVSFFPLLVAGPIERSSHLLPQIEKPRVFDYNKSIDGLRQILWGLFKKIVVADSCAEYANAVFANYNEHSGSTLIVGAICFAFQIYGDFSGYSDIALGSARLLGFELLQNFSFPYFSRDIPEFWRRWHISLSSWFKDYLYIPLGGSRGGVWMKIRNTFIIFLVSGFWHGANWTFIIWGGINALFFLPSLLLGTNRNNIDIVAKNSKIPSIYEFLQIITTFLITTLAWIFFRSNTVNDAFGYIMRILSPSSLKPLDAISTSVSLLHTVVFIIILLLIEWLGRKSKYALENFNYNFGKVIRWAFYYVIIFLIFYYAHGEEEFIYFQF